MQIDSNARRNGGLLLIPMLSALALMVTAVPTVAQGPSHRDCFREVVIPIGRAWRGAESLEWGLDQLEGNLALAEARGCIAPAQRARLQRRLDKLDDRLGRVWQPLASALEGIDECAELLHEGLVELLRTRGPEADVRLFAANQQIADLQTRLLRGNLPDC